MPLIQLTDITYHPKGVIGLHNSDANTPAAPPPLQWFHKLLPNRHATPLRPMLDTLTLTIRNQETLVLMGPSGSGKTTLLKVVAGLREPTRGVITYNQTLMNDVPTRERRLGMVFQEQALYNSMTSEENIGFYHLIHKSPEEIPQRIRDVSRLMNVDLEPLLARRPPKLSGGERQRVAIARALAREVDIFLFDEPLANLDAPLRAQLRVALHRIFTLHPVTTLYTTHDLVEATTIGDRIAILRNGRVEQVGTAGELTYRPLNQFVAGFFGGCNFIEGYIRDDHRWVYGGLELPPPAAKARVDDRITLGVRPTDFQLDPDGPFVITVQNHLPLYDRRMMQLEGRIEGVPITLEIPLDTPLQPVLRASARHHLWFDTATQRRLAF